MFLITSQVTSFESFFLLLTDDNVGFGSSSSLGSILDDFEPFSSTRSSRSKLDEYRAQRRKKIHDKRKKIKETINFIWIFLSSFLAFRYKNYYF